MSETWWDVMRETWLVKGLWKSESCRDCLTCHNGVSCSQKTWKWEERKKNVKKSWWHILFMLKMDWMEGIGCKFQNVTWTWIQTWTWTQTWTFLVLTVFVVFDTGWKLWSADEHRWTRTVCVPGRVRAHPRFVPQADFQDRNHKNFIVSAKELVSHKFS